MKSNRANQIFSWIVSLAMLIALSPPIQAFTPPTVPGVSPSLAQGFSEDPAAYEIYPVPHSLQYSSATSFQPTQSIHVVVGEGVDSYTVDFLQEVFAKYGRTMTLGRDLSSHQTNVVLQLHQPSLPPPTVYPDLFTHPQKYDPYQLTAEPGPNGHGLITITGKNTDCVYYGVATLQMMFSSFAGRYLLPVSIEDYSDVLFRGFVEGFYGSFTYESRENQMRSIRDVKGNLYVFAPKTDPYHGVNWDQLYPQEELEQIRHLVEVGRETKVTYTWSVHIGKGKVLGNVGQTISEAQYQTNVAKLKGKFQQLYDIGVRSFQILNDDYNTGSYTQQVRLLNEMNQWLKEKQDCKPLIYCPKGYNTSWAGDGSEMRALAAMDPDIYFYWTGSDVNSPIEQSNIDWPIQRSNHYPVTWLNYPCSEHGKSGMYLGDISHYVSKADGLQNQMGIISNPVDYPESNKTAYFQLLSWGWNRDHYTEYMLELWEDSFKYLQPEVYEEYLTIARNVSNCPGSSRIPQGFPESEYLKDTLHAVQQKILTQAPLKGDPEVAALLQELGHIINAVEQFRAKCATPALVQELDPWLSSLAGVAQAAKGGIEASIALQDHNLEGAWSGLAVASLGLEQWDHYETPNYPGVIAKGGSRRLQPFAQVIIQQVSAQIGALLNPDGLTGDPAFFGRLGGKDLTPDANSKKMFDDNDSTYAAYDAGFVQQAGDYIGLDLGSVETVTGIRILQGQNSNDGNYFHKGVLQFSLNGKDWSNLGGQINSREILYRDQPFQARYVRLFLEEIGYGNKQDFWTRIRTFQVDTASQGQGLYTNLSETPGVNLSYDGGQYTLSFQQALPFRPGQYVGLDLGEVMGLSSIGLSGPLPPGLSLQYSPNGLTWNSYEQMGAGPTAARYVRFSVSGPDPLTALLPTLQVTIANPPVHPKLVDTNVSSLNHGSWDHVFDGNLNTYVQTKVNQAPGQYFIFDLGATIPIHQLKLYTHESNDYIYFMDLSLSSNLQGPWTTIATIDNNTEMEPPHRTFEAHGQGQSARYLKLEITQSAPKAQWLILHEIVLNPGREQDRITSFSGTPGGDFGRAFDGQLSTFFSPGTVTQSDGYFQYLISQDHQISTIKILQDAASICDATLQVQTVDGTWHTLGTLDMAVRVFDTASLSPLVSLRLLWKPGTTPSIAEILLLGTPAGSGTEALPLPLPSIYELVGGTTREEIQVNYGTPIHQVGLPVQGDVLLSGGHPWTLPLVWTCPEYDPYQPGTYTFTGTYDGSDYHLTNPGGFQLTAKVTVRQPSPQTVYQVQGDAVSEAPSPLQQGGEEINLALDQPVYVSGVEVGTKTPPSEAVDGKANTYWSSNKIKNVSPPNHIPQHAWIVVDLGPGVSSLSSISMSYHNKVWPTDYVIQVAGQAFTPTDFRHNVGTVTDPQTFVYQNSADAVESPGLWTTIQKFSNQQLQDNPTQTVPQLDVAIPEGTRYLRLYFTGMNSNAAGDAIGLKELQVMGVRSAPSVALNPAIQETVAVKASASLENLHQSPLPRHAVAVLKDQSRVRLPVHWDLSSVESSVGQTVTVQGTLILPSDGSVTNPDSIPAVLHLTLTPQATPQRIVFNPHQRTVEVGTPFSSLALPQQAVLLLDNGLPVICQAQWRESDYQPHQLGTQRITGYSTVSGESFQIPVHVIRSTPEHLTVTFDSRGGTPVPAQTVPYDGTAQEPPQPSYPGYRFRGWYLDYGSTRPWDFHRKVTSSLTLYAGWTEESADYDDPQDYHNQIKNQGTHPAPLPSLIHGLTDVNSSDWFAPAVSYVVEHGLMVGTGDGQFQPHLQTNRAMIVTILHKLAGNPTPSQIPSTFSDIPQDSWYHSGAVWAAEQGIVQGYDSGLFGPHDPVTREQLALMLYRFAQSQNRDTTVPHPALSSFSDHSAISPWALESMGWAVHVGILSGRDNGQLDPTGSTTRAETAQMLMNLASQ